MDYIHYQLKYKFKNCNIRYVIEIYNNWNFYFIDNFNDVAFILNFEIQKLFSRFILKPKI